MTRRGFCSKEQHPLRLLVALGLCVAAATLSGAVAQAMSAVTPTADTTACPNYNAPNTLTLAGGTPQSAKLGTPFADPLQVTLANTNGCPITTPLAGIAVTFAAPGSGPSGTFSSSGSNAVLVGSNAAGSATASQFTANTLAGGYQVVASSDYGSVSFSLVNTASGVPATIAPLAATSQSASVSTRYAQPLQAQVLDANGNPVTGANVTFSLGSGSGGGAGGSSSGAGSAGASFDSGQTQASALTNSSGIATSPMFTANSVPGKFTVAATTPGISEAASFQLHNLAGKPPLLNPVGKRKLSATVGTRYGRALQAKLTDATGAPLEGMSVTFNLGSGGGGGGAGASGSGAGSAGASFPGGSTQATETTNASGVATSPRFDANTTAGTFTATAAVAGVTNPAEFTLDNLAGKPPVIKALGPAKRSATVDSRYSRPLEVKLTDRKGKALQGESVTFTLGSSGGGGAGAGAGGSGAGGAGASFVGGSAQATETTNASGVAVSPRFEANATAGTFTATATVSGSNAAASIRLDNLGGAPHTVDAGAAATETTSVGSRFPIPLAVTVTDKYDNPVAGVLVTFTAPAGGASGTFSSSRHRHSHAVRVRTNVSGIAVAPAFTANGTTGGYIVKATVKGAAPAAFALVNQPPGV